MDPLKPRAHVFVDILESLSGLADAEVRLAQTKFLTRLGLTSKLIISGLNLFCVVLLGAGTMIAGVVLWVGTLLDGKYWLSALLVGGGMLLIGLPLAARGLQKGKSHERQNH